MPANIQTKRIAWKLLLGALLLVAASSLQPVPPPDTASCLSVEEARLFQLINEYRKSKKLPAVPYSAALTKVAQLHVRNLQEYHNPQSKKCNMHSWYGKGAWKSCCYTSDHKNPTCMWDKPRELTSYQGNGYEISNYYSSSDGKVMNAAQALKQWKESAPHHAVIVNSGIWKGAPWKAMGLGISKNYAVVWFGNEPDSIRTFKICP